MNIIHKINTASKSPQFATLTALATACALLLSAPVNAEDTTTSTATPTNVPSAVDSSKRIYRRASSSSTPSSTASAPVEQPTYQPSSNNSNISQPTNVAQTNTNNPSPTIAKPSAVDQARDVMANTPSTGNTRLVQREPVVSTGIDISKGQLANIPTSQVQLSDVSFVPTVLIPQVKGSGVEQLDVSLLDYFIDDVSPNARHYPPNFPNRSQRYYTREQVKALSAWIDPYAKAPNASYEVLIRAAKLNGMGRNLDLGSDAAVRGGQYVARAIEANPSSGEANFLYGMMLSEGGGFKEGQKYLDKAVSLGYTEAEQSLAQSDLLSDRRSNALERLRRLEQKMPNDPIIREQIKIVEDGKFYIWDIASPDIDVKPVS